MPVKFVLRLILAITFATLAVIFSALIPPTDGANPLVVKAAITTLSGLIGFLLFPDIATKVTHLTVSIFNLTVSRISTEVLTQLLRVRGTAAVPVAHPVPQVGGIAIARPQILDTSSLIDGRILEVAKTGFLSGLILVPNFILLELQQVADSADMLKRGRGRRGFEILSELKKVPGIKVEIWDKEAGGKAVDDKLLKLVKNLHGKIVTTDFNLNKLAVAHGVTVLNVNDLNNAVKISAIPGEKMKVKVVHIGKDPRQGVGYLEDGTMIVIEDGAADLGKEVETQVLRVIQGSAGRMIFSKKI